MRKVLIIIAVAAIALAAGGWFAFPHAWQAYERATAPSPQPLLPERYDPDFASRTTAQWLATCHPTDDAYDWMAIDSMCEADFAERPHDAALLAPRLLEFLHSTNGREAAEAALILGWFDQRDAAPQIAGLLSSADWRVVQAASRSLGWLGARDALPALDRTARDYWLPQVRAVAAASANAIREDGALPRPRTLRGDGGVWSELQFHVAEPDDVCPGDVYRWRDKPIRFGTGAAEITTAKGERRPYARQVMVRPGGRLVGTDAGEWGGALLWRPWFARAVVLHNQNTFSLTRGGDVIMGLFGSQHMVPYAYAAEILVEDGKPRLGPPIELPGGAYDLSAIGPGLFAARAGAGVLVLDHTRVLGIAECAF